MSCAEQNPLPAADGALIAVLIASLGAVLLIAGYFDLRKQERQRPEKNWSGPFPVRYLKHMLVQILMHIPFAF